MYLQITTRCQMACDHCCFACRPGVGYDMTKEIFIAACKLAYEKGDYIALGGGEPTLHPEFWEYLGIAMKYSRSSLSIFIATNGANTEDAMAIAELTEQNILHGVLSQDEWHDPIDQDVIDRFARLKKSGKHEGVRTNQSITPHGSALRNGLYTTSRDECCCHDVLVHPSGRVFGCGCRKTRFGTVHEPDFPDWFVFGDCAEAGRRQYEQDMKELLSE